MTPQTRPNSESDTPSIREMPPENILLRFWENVPLGRRATLSAAALAALTICGSLLYVELDYARFSLAPLAVFLAGLVLGPNPALASQVLHLAWTAIVWYWALGIPGLFRPEVIFALSYCGTVSLVSRYRTKNRLPAPGKAIVAVGSVGFVTLALWLSQLYPHLAMILFATVVVALMVYFGKSALRYRFWLMAAAVFSIHLIALPLLALIELGATAPDFRQILLFGVAVHVPGELLMGLIASRLAYDLRRIAGMEA